LRGITVGPMAAPTPTVVNRRARHDYAIEDTFECGIILVGGEVKSIRDGKVVLRDAYARVENGEVWLYAMHISPYAFSREVDPDRRRKLLLNRREIVELTEATQNQGIALVPLKLYFKDRRVKVELGVGRGKKTYDKRQALAERDAMREAERSLKSSRR
jgi:SsrA-binding protein